MTKAAIATASVKAQALALVEDLRVTLDRLDTVLAEGVPDVDEVLSSAPVARETGARTPDEGDR